MDSAPVLLLVWTGEEDCLERLGDLLAALVAAGSSSDAADGGVVPLGRELPFLGAGDGESPPPPAPPPPAPLPLPPSPPPLFMLLIMSRTELFRLAAARAAAEAAEEAAVDDDEEVVEVESEEVAATPFFVLPTPEEESPLDATVVTSPVFRSTPTMDQGRFGRGLGMGFGFGYMMLPPPVSAAMGALLLLL